MNTAVTIGPVAISLSLLVQLAGVLSGWALACWLAARRRVEVDVALYVLLASALLGSRLAFVLQFWEAYAQDPWSILDIRDGGGKPLVGLLAAATVAVMVGSWRRALAVPLLSAIAASALVWMAASVALQSHAPVEKHLPELALPSLAGTPVPLERFKGKPIVMNLWATWCPPCRREMPILQRGQQTHPDVNFVFLNQGEQGDAVNTFLVANHLAVRNVLLDLEGQAIHLGGGALPTTLFFDGDGRLVDTRIGELSSATLSERLQALTH